MKTGMLFFIIGLVMIMLGIYLSAYWGSIGTLISIVGGFMLGTSSYFFGKEQVSKTK
ncbi:hypothetical protein [Bacillus sp. BHET2]|uniref:hypothetical protein n=1 Tax=Bacillus sp. BHET2 TaxID=2583818 RepID=UPI00148627DA|nr:hypothetical protein [Bacillus sp. BHET2]